MTSLRDLLGVGTAVALCAVVLAPTTGLAAQAPDGHEAANRLRAEIREAVLTGSESGLANAVIRARRAVSAFPDDAMLNHYLGYALYRTGAAMFEHDEGMAVGMLEESETYLQRAIEIEPIAESHALLASGLGMRILDPAQAMSLGMRHDAEMARARSLGPENPRVRLLEGISAYHSPQWGGGPEAALQHFRKAIEWFGAGDPEPPLPAWGLAEAHAWLGQAHAAMGQVEDARRAWERALELEPEYAWVRDDLLPGLEGGR